MSTRQLAVLCCLVSLSGCGTFSGQTGSSDRQATSGTPTDIARKRGGYYLDDGPGQNPPADLDTIPDAVPRWEPLNRGTARPYSVMGRGYTPMTELGVYSERGIATWYGRRYHGRRTASGEAYDMYAMTGAHTTLPIPSYARVTNLDNGRSVVVRINDRGPFLNGRLIDLSYAAAHKLDIVRNGSGPVEVEAMLPPADAPSPQAARRSTPPPTPSPADAPAAPTGESAPVAASSPVHYLQLGAFSVQENAQRFMEHLQLQLAGLNATLSLANSDSMFRVHSGPYASRAQALEAAEQIGQVLGNAPILATPR